ncbi:DUF397 domain-containing protein [Streptomyces sp. R21]|uniref:DUF397 domain-containing protein n=1 Tax=Streptomyces sp. R21 TaxID=3238627 RepID=A0AB39NYL1_9ACTN
MTHISKALRSIDVAPEEAWRKSSYSDQGGGNCVEVADLTGQVGVRDSKVEAGPAFRVSSEAFGAFISGITA